MKQSEAVRQLISVGYILHRQGKKHGIWKKDGWPQIELPRHKKDLSKGVRADIQKKLTKKGNRSI